MTEGIYITDKPAGITSFDLVRRLRRELNIKKIGHAGTLDPFATGLMILLVGRAFTKLSDQLLLSEKEYTTTLLLGVTTDTYDSEGAILSTSSHIPTLEEVKAALAHFQGEIDQIPPMYSAKKIKGKKLYELARKGIEIERKPVKVTVTTTLVDYSYPYLSLHVTCSKGTYIRSIGHDLGQLLGCGAHLIALRRLRQGEVTLPSTLGSGVFHYLQPVHTADGK